MEVIRVGISEFSVAKAPSKLITMGLGSCVGIAIYEPRLKIGGLSHILLPDSQYFANKDKPEKFADLALPMMVSEIKKTTGVYKLYAKIAGGASMFPGNSDPSVEGIGQKNIRAVENILNSLGITIVSSHIGGNMGRTMTVDLENFEVTVSLGSKQVLYL